MAKIKIDGFKLYKKTDTGDVFVADIEKTARTKEFFRTMAIGTYGISAYRVVADVIDPSKSSVVESIKRYFDVNPFYRIIIRETIIDDDKVTVKWTNETNINYIDGYEVFRVNETESGMTYELVDTIASPEATEYVFMRDNDTTYTYVISPKTYEGFHEADSNYIEVMFARIPPVMLIEPTDAVIYTARWKYDGDEGYDPDHDWKPEPVIELPANTIRFRFEESDYNPTGINNGGTWTKVADSSFNDWDWYCADTDWDYKFVNTETFEGLLTEEHKVSIIAIGDMSNIRSNNPDLDVLGDGSSSYGLFGMCTGLTSIPENSFNDVTDAPYMFYNCTGLTSIPDNSFENVIGAEYMFAACTGLTRIGDNTFNNVTNVDDMLIGCKGFTSIGNNIFNNVTNANRLFAECTELTSIGNNSFNSVTDASAMFSECTGLTSIGNNSFNNVTKAEAMFAECTGLTSIPADSFNSVTNAVAMFAVCTGLASIPENSFNNVTMSQSMFSGCTALTSIPADSFNNVTYADGMFYGCTGLRSIPENSFNGVTEAREMFNGCYNVQTGAFALYNKWNAGGKVMEHDGTFENCGANTETGLTELQQIPEDWGGLKGEEPVIELPPQTIRFRFEESDYNPTGINNGGTWTKVTGSSFNDWDWYCEDTDWSYKFLDMKTGNGLLTEEHKVSIIATGDMSNLRSNYSPGDGSSIYSLFKDCTGLTSIGNNTFNDVTYATETFARCTGLTSIPENSFNSVSNAQSMFSSCTGLTSTPENSFNNVTIAGWMFSNCTSLANIPENSFNNVTDAYGMFEGCVNVEHGALDLYNNLKAGGNVSEHTATFRECGQNTVTGLADLQQIPEDWGGLKP